MSIFIKGMEKMRSILIKNMKMPKLEKTYKVRLYKAVDGRIIVTACGVKENVFQPVGEAIEVPTPHGRLGDLDALWDRMYKYSDNEGAKMPFGDNDFMIHRDSACELIEDAPTVIEVED